MVDAETFARWDSVAEKECPDCGKLWPSGHRRVMEDGGERFWCYMDFADVIVTPVAADRSNVVSDVDVADSSRSYVPCPSPVRHSLKYQPDGLRCVVCVAEEMLSDEEMGWLVGWLVGEMARSSEGGFGVGVENIRLF